MQLTRLKNNDPGVFLATPFSVAECNSRNAYFLLIVSQLLIQSFSEVTKLDYKSEGLQGERKSMKNSKR